jgi:hypothetical protein
MQNPFGSHSTKYVYNNDKWGAVFKTAPHTEHDYQLSAAIAEAPGIDITGHQMEKISANDAERAERP